MPHITAHIRWLRAAPRLAAAILVFSLPALASAQVGGGRDGGSAGTTTPPAASANLKRSADRTDPIGFLLDRKKQLLITKPMEDTLKAYRDEMRHMQDVIYKDLDKAALKKEQGIPPGPLAVANMVKDADVKVKDIQDAYRDRARGVLNDGQRKQVDSLEAIWKRPDEVVADPKAKKPPPPPFR